MNKTSKANSYISAALFGIYLVLATALVPIYERAKNVYPKFDTSSLSSFSSMAEAVIFMLTKNPLDCIVLFLAPLVAIITIGILEIRWKDKIFFRVAIRAAKLTGIICAFFYIMSYIILVFHSPNSGEFSINIATSIFAIPTTFVLAFVDGYIPGVYFLSFCFHLYLPQVPSTSDH